MVNRVNQRRYFVLAAVKLAYLEKGVLLQGLLSEVVVNKGSTDLCDILLFC